MKIAKGILGVLLLIYGGCIKDKSCEGCLPAATQFATVVYYGPLDGDGCDWNLVVNNTPFHPENLDSAFLINPLDVDVTFTPTGKYFICGLAASKIPIVHITFIRKH